MCIKMLESQSAVNTDEYLFFLKGGVVLDREEQMDNPCPGQSNTENALSTYISTQPLIVICHIFIFFFMLV